MVLFVVLRYDLTDVARLAFMFNLPSFQVRFAQKFACSRYLARRVNILNHEMYSETCFLALQLYLLRHTLNCPHDRNSLVDPVTSIQMILSSV